jgi:hypothetical protein
MKLVGQRKYNLMTAQNYSNPYRGNKRVLRTYNYRGPNMMVMGLEARIMR